MLSLLQPHSTHDTSHQASGAILHCWHLTQIPSSNTQNLNYEPLHLEWTGDYGMQNLHCKYLNTPSYCFIYFFPAYTRLFAILKPILSFVRESFQEQLKAWLQRQCLPILTNLPLRPWWYDTIRPLDSSTWKALYYIESIKNLICRLVELVLLQLTTVIAELLWGQESETTAHDAVCIAHVPCADSFL